MKKLKKIYYESGHGLVWCKFVEVGCPAKKEDYFITEEEVLNLDIVKEHLRKSVNSKLVLKDPKTWNTECDICHRMFTKHGLKVHTAIQHE